MILAKPKETAPTHPYRPPGAEDRRAGSLGSRMIQAALEMAAGHRAAAVGELGDRRSPDRPAPGDGA